MSKIKKARYAVAFRRSYTQSTKGTPPVEWFTTRREAEERAEEFNRHNQDKTWNAVYAYAVDTSAPGPI